MIWLSSQERRALPEARSARLRPSVPYPADGRRSAAPILSTIELAGEAAAQPVVQACSYDNARDVSSRRDAMTSSGDGTAPNETSNAPHAFPGTLRPLPSWTAILNRLETFDGRLISSPLHTKRRDMEFARALPEAAMCDEKNNCSVLFQASLCGGRPSRRRNGRRRALLTDAVCEQGLPNITFRKPSAVVVS